MLWPISQITNTNANDHAELEQPPEPAREPGAGEDRDADHDRRHPPGEPEDRVGEAEHAALPGLEVLAALHQRAEVARRGSRPGPSAGCSRSIVSENAAHQPMTPAMISHTARAVGRVCVRGCVMPRIMASGAERMPRATAVAELPRGERDAHSPRESAIMVVDASRPRRHTHHQKTSGDECPSQHEPRSRLQTE